AAHAGHPRLGQGAARLRAGEGRLPDPQVEGLLDARQVRGGFGERGETHSWNAEDSEGAATLLNKARCLDEQREGWRDEGPQEGRTDGCLRADSHARRCPGYETQAGRNPEGAGPL